MATSNFGSPTASTTPSGPGKRTITNKHGLPSTLYNALANDTYVGGGDISITRLIAPPRIVALRKRHESEIVEDASDRIWSLLGQSAHLVAERAAKGLDGVTVESRLSMPIDGIIKPDKKPWVWQLSGQPDVYEKGVLSDYKITSVWSFMFGDKPEWDQQVNLQAMLHRHNGDQVEKVQIIGILRDWQKRKAQYEKDYPDVQVKVVPFPLWTYEEQVDFAMKRVRIHQTAQKDFKLSNYDPNSLPLCTPEERWLRSAKWAVKKQDKYGKINKKSDRLLDTKEEAEKFMSENRQALPKGKTYAPLEERPGTNIRCMDYCDVAMFCPFGRALKDAQQERIAASQVGKDDQGTLGLDEEEAD